MRWPQQRWEEREREHGCQMANFDAFLPLDCARVEGVGAQSKERKGSNFAAQRSGAIVLQARRAKRIQPKNLAIAIWQPCLEALFEGAGAGVPVEEGVVLEAPLVLPARLPARRVEQAHGCKVRKRSATMVNKSQLSSSWQESHF